MDSEGYRPLQRELLRNISTDTFHRLFMIIIIIDIKYINIYLIRLLFVKKDLIYNLKL